MLKSIFSAFSICFFLSFFRHSPVVAQEFISIKGTQFIKNQQPYYFLGTNFWYGMNLGIANNPDYRGRLIRELDTLQRLGITNLRVMAASEGPDSEPWRMVPALQTAPRQYNKDLLLGLDFLLAELAKRDMSAVICLNNMWPWSGGFAQYMNWVTQKPIPYPPPAPDGKWLPYMKFAAQFFRNKEAQQLYQDHLSTIIQRTNSITNIPYKEDPTIMAWQLANEPRPVLGNRFYRRWIAQTAAFIKALDKNHLVSIGSEGNAFLPLSNKFKKEHRIKNIDYATMHIWIQNWKWYDPTRPEKTFQKALDKAKNYIHQHTKLAQRLNMPIVLEEFGIARDQESYEPTSSTHYRDQYYTEIFSLLVALARQGKPLAGCNFWAWAGEGRPRQAKAIWKAGDEFIGDPPFEYQGWYSIYDRDESTLDIIQRYAKEMKEIHSLNSQ